MESFAKFLNAARVIPLTSGGVSENYYSRGNFRPHDGSISGLVLLSSVLLISVLYMFGVQLVEDEKIKNHQIYSYLCIVVFLVIAVCVVHLVIEYRLRQADVESTKICISLDFHIWEYSVFPC